jgi:hypothetical protein
VQVARTSTLWENACIVCAMAADALMHADAGTSEDLGHVGVPGAALTPRRDAPAIGGLCAGEGGAGRGGKWAGVFIGCVCVCACMCDCVCDRVCVCLCAFARVRVV